MPQNSRETRKGYNVGYRRCVRSLAFRPESGGGGRQLWLELGNIF